MKRKIGDKVQMKPSNAKWHLEHPEIYVYPLDEESEDEILLHMACALGEPVYGVITGHGNYCYAVKFKVGSLVAHYAIESKYIVLK